MVVGVHGRGVCVWQGGVHGGGVYGRGHMWWGDAWQEGACMMGTMPPTSDTTRYGLVVMHSRAVRILLECILVTNNVDGHHQAV